MMKNQEVRKSNWLFLCIISLFAIFVSCSQADPYSHYLTIPAGKWAKDASLSFQMDSMIVDLNKRYDISLELINNNQYPYQNLWLNVSHNLNDTIFVSDTIEVKLADEYGRWLGSGAAGLFQYEVPYKTAISLDTTYTYIIKINHAMQDAMVKGIEKVGVIVKEMDM